jgi:6-phosphogluconolactonase
MPKIPPWRAARLYAGEIRAVFSLPARNTIMLVAGGDKAEPLHAVFEEPFDPRKYPAQIVNQSPGNVMWFMDKAAARKME